jgi:hypothetical protein
MDDLKDLIAAALTGTDGPPIVGHERAVYNYIRSNRIRVGGNPIALRTIYKDYVKKNPKGNIGPKLFNRHFKKYFEVKRSSNVVFFYLEPDSFGLDLGYTIYKDPTLFRKKKHGKASKQETKE